MWKDCCSFANRHIICLCRSGAFALLNAAMPGWGGIFWGVGRVNGPFFPYGRHRRAGRKSHYNKEIIQTAKVLPLATAQAVTVPLTKFQTTTGRFAGFQAQT